MTHSHWVHDDRAYRKDDVDGGAEGTVVGFEEEAMSGIRKS